MIICSITESAGVDIDVHLLAALTPLTLIARHDDFLTQTLDSGTYFLSLDSVVSGGVTMSGPYDLTLVFTPSP